jgi:hypothetical protein
MRMRVAILIVLFLVSIPALVADSKVKTKMTAQGYTFESTAYIKGQRFRNESSMQIMGASLATIRQCDLKRSIEVNDKNKTYYIIPDREPGPATASKPEPSPSPEPESNEPVRHGGTVTITADVKDTGERKQMFGHTARHVIATMSTETTPDACNPGKSQFQIDGWYIDFNPGQESCVKPEQQVLDVIKPNFSMPSGPVRGRTNGGCEDDYKFQGSGLASFQKLGFAVQTIMTMTGSDGKTATFTREAEEVSSAPLDPALFDIPAGYKQVNSMAALMGINAGGVLGAMARGSMRNHAGAAPESAAGTSAAADASQPKTGRVCVAPVQDNSGRSLNTSALQQRTADEMQGGGVTAIASTDGCPYLVNITVASAKDASAAKKIGGLLGRRAGLGGGSDSSAEATVSYQIVRASDHSVVASGTADAKGSNADDAASQAVSKAVQQASGKVPQQ